MKLTSKYWNAYDWAITLITVALMAFATALHIVSWAWYALSMFTVINIVVAIVQARRARKKNDE